MENQKEVAVVCSHPEERQFTQLTNLNFDYDLVYCRLCGRLVKKVKKDFYIKNVS